MPSGPPGLAAAKALASKNFLPFSIVPSVLTSKAILRQPPAMIAAAEILPENLPDAWADGTATALSIATALSQKFGQTMPWKTVKDFVEDAKKRPGEISFSSSGVYGTLHMATEMFAHAADIKLKHVPFNGGGPALTLS